LMRRDGYLLNQESCAAISCSPNIPAQPAFSCQNQPDDIPYVSHILSLRNYLLFEKYRPERTRTRAFPSAYAGRVDQRLTIIHRARQSELRPVPDHTLSSVHSQALPCKNCKRSPHSSCNQTRRCGWHAQIEEEREDEAPYATTRPLPMQPEKKPPEVGRVRGFSRGGGGRLADRYRW